MPMTTPGKFDSNGAWDGFRGEIWQEEINVRDFIQKNYTPYDGDEAFLTDPTDRTQKLWNHVQKLQKEEREKGGVLECETEVVSGLTAYGAGYISEDMKELEQIVGLQTDKPLKRAFMPYGGIRMAVQAAETYGYEINPELKKIFTTYVTTHNDAVFGAYTPEMRLARKTHVVTGLPDTYGRGRIVGDYRRVALYGIDRLIEAKTVAHYRAGCGNMYDDVIRMREEISQQLKTVTNTKDSTLYPILKRLQGNGLVVTYDQQYQGRNRRYYQITPEGRGVCQYLENEWRLYVNAIYEIAHGGEKQ